MILGGSGTPGTPPGSLTSVEMVPPQDTLLAPTQEQFTEPPSIVYDIGNVTPLQMVLATGLINTTSPSISAYAMII